MFDQETHICTGVQMKLTADEIEPLLGGAGCGYTYAMSSLSSSSSVSTMGSSPVGIRRHLHQTLPALSVHRC